MWAGQTGCALQRIYSLPTKIDIYRDVLQYKGGTDKKCEISWICFPFVTLI